MLSSLITDLTNLGSKEKAKNSAWFFKTGKGQYGYGDVFIGVTVPEQRKVARKYKALILKDAITLLHSEIHEYRLTALIILTEQFKVGSDEEREQIYNLYLKNTKYINNWDLVDASAAIIVGEYLFDKDRSILEKLAHSDSLWERRIAIIATFYFIQKKEWIDTFKIADLLMSDEEDLIQKAVGWMLREVGKRVSEKELVVFLKTRYKTMPRTMLRYAIERFSPEVRGKYLKGVI